MKFRGLALDLDGTFLRRGDGISVANLEAVRAAQSAGMTVMVATARWHTMAERVAREIPTTAPLIACSGAQVRIASDEDIMDVRLPTAFAEFIQKTTTLSKQDRLDLMAHMLEHGVDVDAAMQATGIKPQTFDDATLRVAVVAAIAANPKAVADFKKGKDAAKMSIVGAVMKANKGAPNEVVRKLVDEEIVKV